MISVLSQSCEPWIVYVENKQHKLSCLARRHLYANTVIPYFQPHLYPLSHLHPYYKFKNL